MLLKNGEPYNLTANDVKALKQRFRHFPVVITYAKERIQPPSTPHNIQQGIKDKPASISVPFSAQVKTKSGIVEWRYAEVKKVTPSGNVLWEPRRFALMEGHPESLSERDIEKLWWLYNACPFVKGGLNFNGKMPKFEFEDKVKDADMKAEYEAELSEIKALIYSERLGLGEKKLRAIAKAYFVPNVDSLTFSQVKLAVEHEVFRDQNHGVEKFKDLVDSDDVVKIKGMLQEAMDKNLLTFMAAKKTWAWVSGPGKKNVPVIEVSPVANPYDAIYEHYTNNRKFAEELHTILKGASVVKQEEPVE